MTNVAIYLAAIPKRKNEIKQAVLRRFFEGIRKAGDKAILVEDHSIIKSDIAVIQGFVYNDLSAPHLQLRKSILESNNQTVIIDSNLFQFINPELQNYYLRYSVNGIFPNTGFYFDNKLDNDRWQSISAKLNFQIKPYRENVHKSPYILICLQRIDGWSMQGVDVQEWLNSTVRNIRIFTNKPIKVRKHPGDRRQELIKLPKGVILSSAENIIQDLEDTWATITFNSSPGVASLMCGVPVFVTDPIPQRSQTYPICNLDISKIDNPILHDRWEWINRISQSHWNDDEVISGKAWMFMRDRLQMLKHNPC